VLYTKFLPLNKKILYQIGKHKIKRNRYTFNDVVVRNFREDVSYVV
jgi:hypothetical protein